MLVEPGETFEGGLNVFGGDVANLLGLENTDQPPVAVTIVHKEKRVALDDVGLTFNGGSKAVEGVDEVEVDGFIWDGQGR